MSVLIVLSFRFKSQLTQAKILAISVYVGFASQASDKISFGKHECAFIYNCTPDYSLIISEEMSGGKIDRLPDIRDDKGQVLLISTFSLTISNLLLIWHI